MKFKKQESLLSVLLGTGLYLIDSLRERLPDNMETTSKEEPGRRMKPRPTAWAAPPTLFAAKKIPKYSAK